MEDRDRKSRLVVGITGRIGAGKTTAAEYLVAKYAFDCIRYSQVLAEWYNVDPQDKTGLQVIGWDVMSGGQQPELNRRLIAKMFAKEKWCVDGLRHPIDYESLKNTFASKFYLICIDCPQQERWTRLRKRSRFDTFEKFCIADAYPVEQNIAAFKDSAAVCIENIGPIEGLYEKLTDFTVRLGRGNQ